MNKTNWILETILDECSNNKNNIKKVIQHIQENDFDVDLPLTNGTATIDFSDYIFLNGHKYSYQKTGANSYVVRLQYQAGKSPKMIYLHREILGLVKGDAIVADHKNHNTLDNTKRNLRAVTVQGNCINQRTRTKTKHKEIKYKGVTRSYGKYVAQIKYKYKAIYCGRYDTQEQAARAYDLVAKWLYGDLAYLNFPKGAKKC